MPIIILSIYLSLVIVLRVWSLNV